MSDPNFIADPWTAQELLRLALTSTLAGATGYSGIRLLKGIKDNLTGYQKPKSELDIRIPQVGPMAKTGEADEWLAKYVYPVLAGVGGVGVGFGGASALYEHFKKKQLNSQISDAEKQYLFQLQQANTKLGEYPNVDAFIEGMITKVGNDIPFDQRGLMDHLSSSANWVGDKTVDLSKKLFRGAGDSELGGLLKGSLLLTLLAGAGATYHIGNKMQQNNDKLKRETIYPTDVKITNPTKGQGAQYGPQALY